MQGKSCGTSTAVLAFAAQVNALTLLSPLCSFRLRVDRQPLHTAGLQEQNLRTSVLSGGSRSGRQRAVADHTTIPNEHSY
jgi:hypothetical protein